MILSNIRREEKKATKRPDAFWITTICRIDVSDFPLLFDFFVSCCSACFHFGVTATTFFRLSENVLVALIFKHRCDVNRVTLSWFRWNENFGTYRQKKTPKASEWSENPKCVMHMSTAHFTQMLSIGFTDASAFPIKIEGWQHFSNYGDFFVFYFVETHHVRIAEEKIVTSNWILVELQRVTKAERHRNGSHTTWITQNWILFGTSNRKKDREKRKRKKNKGIFHFHFISKQLHIKYRLSTVNFIFRRLVFLLNG